MGVLHQGRGAMPINRLLKDASPADAERLNRAFALTLKSLELVDRNDPVCEIVARKVIEIDGSGTHEPREIADRVAQQLGISK